MTKRERRRTGEVCILCKEAGFGTRCDEVVDDLGMKSRYAKTGYFQRAVLRSGSISDCFVRLEIRTAARSADDFRQSVEKQQQAERLVLPVIRERKLKNIRGK